MSSQPHQNASVAEFFDEVSQEYDASILQFIPPYIELLDALIQFTMRQEEAPQKRSRPLAILELGCGTGNVSKLLLKSYPSAQLTLVDLSKEMLAQSEQKLAGLLLPGFPPPVFLEKGFMDLAFEPERFDLIVASCALHHLLDEEKHVLYQRLFQWLRSKGRFVCADGVLSLPAETAYELTLNRGFQWAIENGATAENITLWRDHIRKFDHYLSLFQHFQWLHEVGFQAVDCYWKKLYWAVFGGEKP